MQEILSPINDWIFKLLFGDERNKSLLISFLKAFINLPDEEYDIILADTHLKPDNEDGKLAILDVKIRTKSGKVIDIEIQVRPFKGIGKRISYYKSMLIVEQLGKGGQYENIQQVICIVITDYVLFETVKEYVNHFRFYNKANDLYFDEIPEEIYTIEIPKLPKESDGSMGWNWIQFLGSQSREEFEMIAEKHRDIRQAVDLLYELSADDEGRAQYDLRRKAQLEFDSFVAEAYADGQEAGIQEGMQKGREAERKAAEERRRQEQAQWEERRRQEQIELLELMNQGYTVDQIKEKLAAAVGNA